MPIVDSENKRVPVPTQGWADGGAMCQNGEGMINNIRGRIESGELELPLYGDFAGMKPEESRATWNMMLREESTTRIMVKTMSDDGFDPTRDQIMNYSHIEFQGAPQYCDAARGGGILTDWNLKSTVDGLYAAGTSLFSPEDHSFAAATGRYAGRKAAAYAKTVSAGKLCRSQIDEEKERILAPTRRDKGIDWKELHNGLCRVMQYFVSQYKTERTLKLALEEIERIEKNAVPQLFALDPHKLMRSIEDLNLIQYAKIMINAMKERKASSPALGLERMDYPEADEAELGCYLTLRQENGEIKFDRLPTRFWGNMKEQYEAHNKDYTGVYKPEN